MKLFKKILLLVVLLVLVVLNAQAQKLSFDNHREIAVPEYALLRIGPFYSNLSIRQTAGYRYTAGEGEGTDFLFANQRGVILEDGEEFPLITTLNFRNYLLLTRNIDLDLSGKIVYGYYPLGTQEEELYLDLVEEGMQGLLSSEIAISPFLKLFLYENARYSTDYVDTRGFMDDQGGQRYENFRNEVGADLDWMVARGKNMHFNVKRVDEIPIGNDTFDDQERVEWSEDLSYEQKVSIFMSAGVRVGAVQADYATTNRGDFSSYNASVFASAALAKATMVAISLGYSDGTEKSDDGSEVPLAGPDVSSSAIGSLSFETVASENLQHSYGFARSHRGGFTSTFEIWNVLYYRLMWSGLFTTVSLTTEQSLVETSQDVSGKYVNWANSLRISRELLSFLTLDFDAMYAVRDNEFDAAFDTGAESVDVEWSTDYDTWSGRVGTTFALTKKIDFRTSFQHVERMSDSEDLDYTRDMYEAMFVYAHDF